MDVVSPETRSRMMSGIRGKNTQLDKKHKLMLNSAGWRTLTIWECAIKGPAKWSLTDLFEKTSAWINSSRKVGEVAGLPRKVSDRR